MAPNTKDQLADRSHNPVEKQGIVNMLCQQTAEKTTHQDKSVNRSVGNTSMPILVFN